MYVNNTGRDHTGHEMFGLSLIAELGFRTCITNRPQSSKSAHCSTFALQLRKRVSVHTSSYLWSDLFESLFYRNLERIHKFVDFYSKKPLVTISYMKQSNLGNNDTGKIGRSQPGIDPRSLDCRSTMLTTT